MSHMSGPAPRYSIDSHDESTRGLSAAHHHSSALHQTESIHSADTGGGFSYMSDPFVDPRASIDSSGHSQMSGQTGMSRPYNPHQAQGFHQYAADDSSSTGGGTSPVGGRAEGRDRSATITPHDGTSTRPRGNTLEVSRGLNDALNDELETTPSEREMLQAERRGREIDQTKLGGRRRSSGQGHHDSSRDKFAGKDGFWQQLRTGTGWFSPVVPPPPTLTREEREAQERARVAKLKETGQGSARSQRPSFMKRMSSGVEMLGFGSGSGGGGGGGGSGSGGGGGGGFGSSPSKKGQQQGSQRIDE